MSTFIKPAEMPGGNTMALFYHTLTAAPFSIPPPLRAMPKRKACPLARF
jgi:hypothetical protein